MNLLFISDITIDPIAREISKIQGDIRINTEYHEDLSARLLNTGNSFADYDFVLVHSDQIFHNKPVTWQKQLIELAINLFSKNPTTRFIFTNTFSLAYESRGLAESTGHENNTFTAYQSQLDNLRSLDNTFVLDIKRIISNEGINNLYNYSLGILYQMPYTKKMLQLLASEIVSLLTFLSTEEKKVIVLDCDNTLWRGVVGEDGIEGIGCDKNHDGIVFYNFQQFLAQKKAEGFILCLCSKNNEADVKEAFEKKSMPLTWNDFILKKVNWHEKSNNVHEIAKELNLGEDSFIFVDDNPFELGVIQEFTKIKTVFKFENNFNALLSLQSSYAFRRKKILKADLEKTQQYQTELLRKENENSFGSVEDYIKSLEIKVDIKENDVNDLERLAQMTEKTNQFNFNKKAFSVGNLKEWIDKGNFVFSCKVSDKFGDYGTVGLILAKKENSDVILENYLMSCRALGKNVEFDFYNHTIETLKKKGLNLKEIIFVESAKNEPARTFLKQINYDHISRTV
ncbi:MAG: HAD-IIIC family phosphatase, partial [Bacteroidia bacterium]|nr:HAD-IIIC family phosphatase [Bacteroidia bacterium]